MGSANGGGPRRAVLYARVSTDEQARSGYSLAQQLEALRGYAAREGYEVLEEVADPGQSGASLERPGMDRVRDLVAAGGVTIVLAQDRDRFSREPAYHYLLRREFADYGTEIRALNDRGDGSPEGELTDGILDQLGKYERAKIAERSRRGRLRKAREGKIVATHAPRYGFRLNGARDAYEVHEPEMEVVRRIFHMVGTEGMTLRGVAMALEREGIPTPKGARRWDRSFFRTGILDDVYRPHTFEEVRELVSPDVAARLDPAALYGIWWFNRRGLNIRPVSEPSENGRNYRKAHHWHHKPKEEWIAVPVPDSGIPRDLVEAARKAIENNRRPARAGRRFWELTGGVAYCRECGHALSAYHSVKVKRGRRHEYDYYRCPQRDSYGVDACHNKFRPRAEALEGLIWGGVSGYMRDAERLRADLERAIDLARREAHGDPDREAKAWARKLADVDRKRARYQEMAAEELITLDELRARLAGLGETRQTAERELAALRGRADRIEELERDAEAILEGYARMTPEALDALTPEERHRFYRMLGLRVTVGADRSIEISGTFIADGPLKVGEPSGASGNGRANGSTKTAGKPTSVPTGGP